MADIEFSYKGKAIIIREEHPHAVVSVDGREFSCHHHHGEGEKGLSMWMCDEAYFASPDIKELARHFADYGYMFDDPNRVVVDEHGQVIRAEKQTPAAKKVSHKKPGGKSGHENEGAN